MATAIAVLAFASGAVAPSVFAPNEGAAAGATGPSPMIAVTELDDSSLPVTSHVAVMNADGSGLRRVTFGNVTDLNETWSPDGSRLAFERWTEDANVDIFTAEADGSGLHQLTSNPGIALSPAWSPDGRTIAYATGRGRLFVMNADGRGKRLLTHMNGTKYPEPGDLSWSPDGRRVAFSAGDVIFVINADGTGRRRLTRGHAFACPAWSPDGQQVAFAAATPPYRSIDVVDPDRRRPRIVVVTRHAATKSGGFAWSPDGRRIVYAREKLGGVHLIDVNGTHDRLLTSIPHRRDRLAGGFSWSPDGSEIAYAGIGIDVVAVDGAKRLVLRSQLGGFNTPRWSLSPRTESC